MAIEIYTSMLCGYCHRAKKLLKSKGQEFEDHGVDFKPELRAEMAERAGGVSTVPQIFVNGTHIGGCDELYALEASGELDGLLNANLTPT